MAPPMAPVAGSASAATPMTAANAVGAIQPGGGPDQGDPIQQLADQIRDAGGVIDEIAASNPSLANEVGQIKQILRSMLVKAAGAASAQTPAGLALPNGQAT